MNITNKKKDRKLKRYAITFFAVLGSALIQAYVIQVFITPSNLLSSGFTGVAILLNKIAALYHMNLSISLFMVLLNLPVAMLCYRSITPKFTIFSLLQVFLASMFLKVFSFAPLFDDLVLNVIFGGFLYGVGTVIALKGNASTGGTDFVALLISNKCGKSIWEYVFVFNCVILCIFGVMFGWSHAGYSILFQFIATKVISAFHHRYDRVTLLVTAEKGSEIIEAYIAEYRHGISKIEATGGYSKKKMELLHTVVSSYEVPDIVRLMKSVDSHVIINMLKTENFFGGFYQSPLE